MAIPDKDKMMRPILEIVSERGVVDGLGFLEESLKKYFPEMTEDEWENTKHTGKGYNQRQFYVRLRYAINELKSAGFMETPSRARYKILPRALVALESKAEINRNYLCEHSPEFNKQIKSKRRGVSAKDAEKGILEEVEKEISEEDAVLNKYRKTHPTECEIIFGRLAKVIFKPDYGVHHRGGTGDKGIDLEIHRYPMKIDRIFVQVKRYSEGNKVGPDAIKAFKSSIELEGGAGSKGIFVTASIFSPGAQETLDRYPTIKPINGTRLAELLIEHRIDW